MYPVKYTKNLLYKLEKTILGVHGISRNNGKGAWKRVEP